MRRITVAIGVVFILGALGQAAAGPLAGVYAVDHLSADWVHRSGPGAPSWYLVEADIVTNVETGEVVASRARGGVGRCTRDGSHCGISPVPRMRVVAYETDLLFRTAHITLRGPGGSASIDFVANPRGSSPAGSIHPCPGKSEAYRDVIFSARATGVAFGRRVSSASDWDRIAERMQREIYVCGDS
ncbi:MAG TPA: hypothetical protein VIG64_15360 [Actinomycetota bacterium]|jgi:hypothetical protein